MGAISQAGAAAGKAAGKAAAAKGLVDGTKTALDGVGKGFESYRTAQKEAEKQKAADAIGVELGVDQSMIQGMEPETLMSALFRQREGEADFQQRKDYLQLQQQKQINVDEARITLEDTYRSNQALNAQRNAQMLGRDKGDRDKGLAQFKHDLDTEDDPRAQALEILLKHGSDAQRQAAGGLVAGDAGIDLGIPPSATAESGGIRLFREEGGLPRVDLGGEQGVSVDPGDLSGISSALERFSGMRTAAAAGKNLQPLIEEIDRMVPGIGQVLTSEDIPADARNALLELKIRSAGLGDEDAKRALDITKFIMSQKKSVGVMGQTRPLDATEQGEMQKTLRALYQEVLGGVNEDRQSSANPTSSALNAIGDPGAAGSTAGGSTMLLKDVDPVMWRAYERGMTTPEQLAYLRKHFDDVK